MHKLPGGPGTVLVKRTFFLKMSFSLQRNAHFYEQNFAKFSREKLAKFAFREKGFGTFYRTLFLPLADQAFQRRDGFLPKASMSTPPDPTAPHQHAA